MAKDMALKCILALWVLLVLTGTGVLLHYSNTEGIPAVLSEGWPAASHIRKPQNRPVLVIFAHPQCPCSAASVGELERLMPFLKGRADVFVAFIQPEGRAPAWVESDLWEKTKAIPGVTVLADPQGREADLFGAKTSGQTFFYDKKGSLVFSGGITPGRGHMGDSEGRRFILSWLDGEKRDVSLSRVFGCSLKEGQRL